MKPKYHLIISGVALAFLMLLAYAKNTEVTKSIRWSERLLTWDDFPIIDAIPGDYHAMVYSDIQFDGDRKNQYLNIYARMIPYKSGRVVKEVTDMEQLLIHEQLHFNITEYHARLFRKEAIAIGKEKLTNNNLQRLGKKYLKKIDSMQTLYDKESEHNTIWPKQRYWELYVAGLLRETAYYANQDLYTYQAFLGGPTPWFRNVYPTIEGELLHTYPESAENKDYGEVYHITQKQDSTIIKFYRNGKPTNGGYFEAALSIITFPDSTSRETHLFDPEGKPFSSATEAHITRIITDAMGNNTRTFYDANKKQVSRDGVFTQKGIWNAAEKSVYSSYFDKHDNPVKYRGTYHVKRIIGDNKLTEKISFFNKDGKPIRDEYSVSTYQYGYDENVVVREVKKLDEDGKYVLGVDGFHTIYEYDERGKTKSEAYFDERGNPSANKEGIHKYTYTYDQYGNNTDMRKFNLRGLPTKGSDDYHQLMYQYDSIGRITFSAKYYPNYVLMFSENKNGGLSNEFVGDSIVNVKNVDVYGDDTVNDLGILVTKQFLNDKKEVIREEFFGADGKWAKTEDEVVSYNYKYDERGNQIEMVAFDSLGKPKAWQEDVATVRWEYDQNNNKIKTTYYTEEYQLANASQGVTYNSFKYDANHNLIERTNYDRNNNPALYDGVFRTNVIINRFGKDSITTNYDINNKIIANGIIKYSYNPQGILLSESTYNEHNQPVLNGFGIHKIVYHHDKYDRYTGYTNYGKNGKRVNNPDGISIMEINLNPSGFLLNYAFYDKNKNPVMGTDGFHRVENFFNDMDEVVRTSTYGIDGKLKNNEAGIADYVYAIDESGRTLRVSFFNADSNPTEDENGVAEYFYAPELNGLFYLEKQLNAKGQEVPQEDI